MKYLLDTNVLIAMFKDQHGIRESIKNASFEECAVSEMTIGELYVGVYKGKNIKQLREVEFVKKHFRILSTSPIIEMYGKVRADLELKGTKIDSMDCLIGCTALFHNLTIVTHNSKHLDRIPGIKLIDWQK